MKTATLTGAALVYAVALAEGYRFFKKPRRLEVSGIVEYHFPMVKPGWKSLGNAPYRPGPTPQFNNEVRWGNVPDFTTKGEADDIIDREKISTNVYDASFPADKLWSAYMPGEMAYSVDEEIYGATRREAAMRAWVIKKLGPDVDIPEELL